MKKALLIISIVLCGCSTVLPPLESLLEPHPEVFSGQYLVESEATALWCDGAGADPSEECQTEEGGKVYLVSPLGLGWSLIRS